MVNKDKLLESAQKFLAKGQLPKAIGEYRKLVEVFPRDFRNRQKLAELLTRERCHDEARQHYEAVARHFTETGFNLKAIAIYKQMQRAEPGREETYLSLAELYAKQGLVGNALNEYRSLLGFYDRHQKSRESVEILRKMVALDPANQVVGCQMIEALLDLDDQDAAGDQFRELIALLDDRGEYASVVRCYEKFGTVFLEEAGLRQLYAKALLLSGQAGRALPLLKELCRESPAQATLLSLLSDCYLALARPVDAGEICQQLLATQPENLGLRERYLRICIDGGNFHEALARMESWRADFAAAGRLGVFKELCLALKESRPDNARVHSLLVELDTTDPDTAEPEPLEEDAAAVTDAPEGPEPSPDFDEDFTLDLIEEAIDNEPPADHPAAVSDSQSPVELELELEFEPFAELPEGSAVDAPGPPVPSSDAAQDKTKPPFTIMTLPDFCELGLDLELADDAAGPAGASAPDPGRGPAPDAEPEPLLGEFETFLEDSLDSEILPEATPGEDADIFAPSPAPSVDADAQSHFDLGIAYKEMGLLDDAISELSLAVKDASRCVDCLTLMAQCSALKGDSALAEATFKEALAQPNLGDDARIALRYELGLLYEAVGRPLEALESFEFVADRDLFFRDVASKQRALRRSLGLDEQNDPPPSGRSTRDRISYV